MNDLNTALVVALIGLRSLAFMYSPTRTEETKDSEGRCSRCGARDLGLTSTKHTHWVWPSPRAWLSTPRPRLTFEDWNPRRLRMFLPGVLAPCFAVGGVVGTVRDRAFVGGAISFVGGTVLTVLAVLYVRRPRITESSDRM